MIYVFYPDYKRTAVWPFIESKLECVSGGEQVLLVPVNVERRERRRV